MKFVKRMLSFVLVLVMMWAIAVPAFALDSEWRYEFRNQFPLLSQGSTKRDYISALQSFLSVYPGASTYIANAGGIDGTYGAGTYNAVRVFQTDAKRDYISTMTVDGIAGGDTWASIAMALRVNGDYFQYNGTNVMRKGTYNQKLSLFYRNGGYTYFHTIVGYIPEY